MDTKPRKMTVEDYRVLNSCAEMVRCQLIKLMSYKVFHHQCAVRCARICGFPTMSWRMLQDCIIPRSMLTVK